MLTKDAAPVIPSFFHLVNYLCERGFKWLLKPIKKLDFFLPQKLNPDICTGAFFRSSDSDALVLGSTELPSSFQQKLSYSGPLKRTAVGYQNIYDAIKDALKENVCLGFTDYYHWWFSNNEAGWAGKLLVVDPNDTEIYQIFFDDNVSLDEREKNIVDVRTTGGMRLKISNSENFAIVKVIPAYAVINDNYFINELLEVFSNKTKFEA
ncbi:uncharacterized protein LOC135143692 [Zophobas morio]|uniref:uncharacterized protein LOC135143692 n=1 Tax=Zophobas morio TaxID=2755281 RepID=UPI0030826D59